MIPQHPNALPNPSFQALSQVQSWQEKYRLITHWGKQLPSAGSFRTLENLITGCEVSAWLAHRVENNRHFFQFDSDSRVINGLAAVILNEFNQKTLEEIGEVDIEQKLKLAAMEKHLTPSRNNGLISIINRAKQLSGIETHSQSAN